MHSGRSPPLHLTPDLAVGHEKVPPAAALAKEVGPQLCQRLHKILRVRVLVRLARGGQGVVRVGKASPRRAQRGLKLQHRQGAALRRVGMRPVPEATHQPQLHVGLAAVGQGKAVSGGHARRHLAAHNVLGRLLLLQAGEGQAQLQRGRQADAQAKGRRIGRPRRLHRRRRSALQRLVLAATLAAFGGGGGGEYERGATCGLGEGRRGRGRSAGGAMEQTRGDTEVQEKRVDTE